MSTPTKCDIIRAGAAARMRSGVCTGEAPPPDCYVTDLATKRDMYLRTKYSPVGLLSGTARDIRNKELAILQTSLDLDLAHIREKYGAAAPAQISWNDFTDCLWNPDGSPGGPYGNQYYGRADLASLGYQPQPLVGATAFQGQLPPKLTNAIPIWVDRILNPDLAVVFLFVLLVAVFAILVYRSYVWTQHAPERARAAKEALRVEKEKDDPYRGTSFESYPADPNAKWQQLIPRYEKEGYCMESYRKKWGMPVSDHCETGDG